MQSFPFASLTVFLILNLMNLQQAIRAHKYIYTHLHTVPQTIEKIKSNDLAVDKYKLGQIVHT